jgi:hypothetical protein
MASFYYTVAVQNTEPSSPQLFWYWVNQDTGQVYLRLVDEWLPIAGGSPFGATEGIFWRNSLDQTAEPSSPEIGDIWIADTNQAYIYTDTWLSLVGG